jgi:hypothetical protein
MIAPRLLLSYFLSVGRKPRAQILPPLVAVLRAPTSTLSRVAGKDLPANLLASPSLTPPPHDLRQTAGPTMRHPAVVHLQPSQEDFLTAFERGCEEAARL